MKIVVFHGSPRKGNTYRATKIFMDALRAKQDVQFTEFFFPASLPAFCTGCQLCLSNPPHKCPHAAYVSPVYDALMGADALVFTTPHYGACSMSSCMKNLLDHLDFLTLTVAPEAAIFSKKAFILTTGSGSAAAIRPIAKYLKNWGVNRVQSFGIRMFTDRWQSMPQRKQARLEKKLRQKADAFYRTPKGFPHLSTLFMYYMAAFILKKYMGEGTYPYEYWTERGYFTKRPF